MKIGYARVSTVGQDLASQEETLKEIGCERIYVEKITGTTTKDRKELKKLLENVRPGDTVMVTKIDRLARSIIDLNKIIEILQEKKVDIYFIKDNLSFKVNETANPLQSLLFNVLGSFAQFERDIIVERTSEGRERAKSRGKHMGRPSQPRKNIEEALQLYNSRNTNGLSVKDIVKLTGVPKATLYVEIRKNRAI
jgi:DNA invertase Pin-like site-specific DNA recombinase